MSLLVLLLLLGEAEIFRCKKEELLFLELLLLLFDEVVADVLLFFPTEKETVDGTKVDCWWD